MSSEDERRHSQSEASTSSRTVAWWRRPFSRPRPHVTPIPDPPPPIVREEERKDTVCEDDVAAVGSVNASIQADEAIEKMLWAPRRAPSDLAQVMKDGSSSARLLLAGAIAGAVSKTATAPLARITILNQVQGVRPAVQPLTLAGAGAGAGAAPLSVGVRGMSVAEALQTIARREGISALWKGNTVTLIHRLPYSAANFYVYEHTHQWLVGQRPRDAEGTSALRSIGERLIAGAVAGSTAVTLAYPLDLVRTRLAAQGEHRYYRGIGHALRTITRDEGPRGLYRGLGATVAGTGPNIALNYCLYEGLKTVASKRGLGGGEVGEPPGDFSHAPSLATVLTSLGCGSLSGAISTTITFPLDLIRRRLQMEGLGGRPTTRYFDVVTSILSKDGFRGLYYGILPEYYKVVPGVGIAFGTYEALKVLLGVRIGRPER